jgi:hypothetical protein
MIRQNTWVLSPKPTTHPRMAVRDLITGSNPPATNQAASPMAFGMMNVTRLAAITNTCLIKGTVPSVVQSP